MPAVCWLIDDRLTESAYETGFPTLADAAREQGHVVHVTKYKPFSENADSIPFEAGSCVITHGTIEFCKQVEKQYGRLWTPGMYFNSNVKSFSRYAIHLADDLLNQWYYLLPYAEFVRRELADFEHVFVKPESGLKEFTGQVIKGEYFHEDISKLAPYGPIDPHALCVIAPAKEIMAEFRYIICEGKVVTGSEYRWGNKLDVRIDTHPLCDALAQKVAEAEWQADSVYVCDVALLEEAASAYQYAKVIELNAFSSSGLYACDTRKIVEAVSAAAARECYGDV